MEQRGFGDLEAVVMDCVWDYAEPVTVREVFDEISQRRQIAWYRHVEVKKIPGR